jgi:hypothetical protein
VGEWRKGGLGLSAAQEKQEFFREQEPLLGDDKIDQRVKSNQEISYRRPAVKVSLIIKEVFQVIIKAKTTVRNKNLNKDAPHAPGHILRVIQTLIIKEVKSRPS